MKKIVLGIVIALLLVAGLVAAVRLKPLEQAPVADTSNAQDEKSGTAPESSLASGRYLDYSPALIAETGYNDTILFFYAPWCPECRAFDQSIATSTIPDGVQILKVDYDNSSKLRQQYQVTLQSTFVKVNTNGDRQSLWVGYEKDKSLNTILENTW